MEKPAEVTQSPVPSRPFPSRLVSMGEILIDFTPAGTGFDPESGNPLFSQNPGGAPANVAACFAGLGGRSSFLGAVGRDAFGSFLRRALEQAGVDCGGLAVKDEGTTLAFVNLSPSGERSFTFRRSPGADTVYCADDIPENAFTDALFFHFGSLSLTAEPARSATFSAASRAAAGGLLLSFDPNWRPALWSSASEAEKAMHAGIDAAGLVKVSEEEAMLLTGARDRITAGRMLAESTILTVMTLGAEGCLLFRPGKPEEPLPVSPFPVSAVDTTGAGDAFWGAFLFFLGETLRRTVSPDGKAPVPAENVRSLCAGQIAELPEAELRRIAVLANAAGALCTTKKGAIPALPSRRAVEQLAAGVPAL